MFLDERLAWSRAAGIAIAFVGLVIVVRWGTGQKLGIQGGGYFLLAVVAALTHAVYTVLGKPLVENRPPLLVTGVSMGFAGLFSLVFVSRGLMASLPTLPIPFWGSILFLGWLSTVFAFAVWSWALQRMPAGRVASFTYLLPLVGVLSGHWLLGEPVTLALALGGVLVVGGIAVVNRS